MYFLNSVWWFEVWMYKSLLNLYFDLIEENSYEMPRHTYTTLVCLITPTAGHTYTKNIPNNRRTCTHTCAREYAANLLIFYVKRNKKTTSTDQIIWVIYTNKKDDETKSDVNFDSSFMHNCKWDAERMLSTYLHTTYIDDYINISDNIFCKHNKYSTARNMAKHRLMWRWTDSYRNMDRWVF